MAGDELNRRAEAKTDPIRRMEILYAMRLRQRLTALLSLPAQILRGSVREMGQGAAL